jgi:beta-ureidopropionase / N-carbamoyl-L-amino-acid hydrolase
MFHMMKSPFPTVNGARLLRRLAELAEFGKNADGGVNRVAYSDYDRDARAFVMGIMTQAGLSTAVDAAGNIVGKCAGSDSKLRPIVTGSHIDTVLNGGNYDGCVGSMSAVEVVQTLADNNLITRHPLEVIIFQNEEQGLFGSRALSGEIRPEELDLVSTSGKTVRDGINFIGGDAARLDSVRRSPGDIAAFLECHIEQGPVLEQKAKNIGVVAGIVAVYRWNVTVVGMANHAGTTPMNARKDAVLSASEFVVAVNRVVTSATGEQVGTVGRIVASPGVVNVVAGEVNLTLELRDLDVGKVEKMFDEISYEADLIAARRGTPFQFDLATRQQPAIISQRHRELLVEVCEAFSFSNQLIQSGAGHDAQAMSHLGPMAMIFIPSVGGISHSPREFSKPDDIVNGSNVHLHLLLKLDQE